MDSLSLVRAVAWTIQLCATLYATPSTVTTTELQTATSRAPGVAYSVVASCLSYVYQGILGKVVLGNDRGVAGTGRRPGTERRGHRKAAQAEQVEGNSSLGRQAPVSSNAKRAGRS